MDSEQIERLVGASDLPSLLAALAHATGDTGLAPDELWLDPSRALEPNGDGTTISWPGHASWPSPASYA